MKKYKKYLVGVPVALVSSVGVMATESTGTANAAVTQAMTDVANDMVATGTAIIPIALTVVGLSIVVVFGVRMFRKVAGR